MAMMPCFVFKRFFSHGAVPRSSPKQVRKLRAFAFQKGGRMGGANKRDFNPKETETTNDEPIAPPLVVSVPTIQLNDGNKMPVLGLGTANMAPDVCSRIVSTGLRAGYRHIDCSPIYNNQQAVGEGIKRVLDTATHLRREDLFLTSKLWNTHHKMQYIKPTLEKTLMELGVDYLDLYLINWPFAFTHKHAAEDHPFPRDAEGHIRYEDSRLAETWAAMEDMVRLGLVRSIGVSNFDTDDLKQVTEDCNITPAVNQIEFHPYCIHEGILNFCHKHNIQVVGHTVLGGQDHLKFETGLHNLKEDATVVRIARSHRRTPAQVLSLFAYQSGLAVIAKTAHAKHIHENLDMFTWRLTDEDMKELRKLNRNEHLHIPPWMTVDEMLNTDFV
eukprot:GILK01006437.1.p1 GENE.GILK01006437.1~~GILK01006437.1.p1  ORF type:complete len:396 (-),score=47.09 GILK01006437.1:65-1222(-)